MLDDINDSLSRIAFALETIACGDKLHPDYIAQFELPVKAAEPTHDYGDKDGKGDNSLDST